jgi:hypothetical protein
MATSVNNDHDVGVAGEGVHEGREVRVPDLHALELRLRLRAAQLKLLYYVRDTLEAVAVVMFAPILKCKI